MPASSFVSFVSFVSSLQELEQRISLFALERLAIRHSLANSVEIKIPPKRGSRNLVYPLFFSDGRRWVAGIPDPETFDALTMQSTVDTVRLIATKTTIPIPCVHAYDTSSENELNQPYMLTGFVEGVPLSDLWTKLDDDAQHKYVFEQVANAMLQLRVLEFDKIGRLEFDSRSSSYTVRAFRNFTSGLNSGRSIEEHGPFETTHAYIMDLVKTIMASKTYPRAHALLFRLIALSFPDYRYNSPPFVLSHPNLDATDVMVDPETCTITGFINWDGVCVCPRLARYPAWITKDWDPLTYRWEESESELDVGDNKEDGLSSSESDLGKTFEVFRELYLSIYAKVDPENARITRHSHILLAIVNSLKNPEMAVDMMKKLSSTSTGFTRGM